MALATVKPRVALPNWKKSSNQCVVPEITAVSNPNRNPPRAATTADIIRVGLLFMQGEFETYHEYKQSRPNPGNLSVKSTIFGESFGN
jgi:hypothetical protein